MKICKPCNGRGYDDRGKRCPNCGGSGAVYTAAEMRKIAGALNREARQNPGEKSK